MEFDVYEIGTLLAAVRQDEAKQRGMVARGEVIGLRLKRLTALRERLKAELDRLDGVHSGSNDGDSSSLDNWAGPFKTLESAEEHMVDLAGRGRNAVWERPEGIYINDGCDSNTGKPWETLPEGARWLDSVADIESTVKGGLGATLSEKTPAKDR